MVYLCGSLAAASPKVTAEIFEATAFADLVSRHRVGSTPKVVVNDTVDLGEPYTPAAFIAALASAPSA